MRGTAASSTRARPGRLPGGDRFQREGGVCHAGGVRRTENCSALRSRFVAVRLVRGGWGRSPQTRAAGPESAGAACPLWNVFLGEGRRLVGTGAGSSFLSLILISFNTSYSTPGTRASRGFAGENVRRFHVGCPVISRWGVRRFHVACPVISRW
ncbi:hypothetical protein DGI_4027 (plasmid) [Megalodesulfovibrio gigas DSM 1382 = ATCC 19364]|uniref:Uncharacterized protein n=1 Tax=Megalodesulfovibrio gigas (strain ATCC 19364 / DSM 1382 / NCIMB 9332 / VKM B-1759) TaxID=1121448 RepID=T2GGB0_MEGG1|nr:hypothetical protein DGI_4027 [Megalodesulfovibrio gigas DSM 1382 = ATCC 19364]